MPRIETQRIWRFLYVSWNQTDSGERRYVRTGLTASMSSQRCLQALRADD